MPRKSYRSKRRKKKGGNSDTRDSGTRRYNLPIPDKNLKKDAGKGATKTVWQLQNSKANVVVINSTRDQMIERQITNCDQFNEYLFSKSLSNAYPALFPKVYALKDTVSELEKINEMNNEMSKTPPETPNIAQKYIWVKEACQLPAIQEIQGDYLEKAIQLLFHLMTYGLCYIDIKPANVGKRGNDYLVIDTGREDIYFIPEEHRKDYLIGEILICCMTLYHYLKSNDGCTESMYQKIKFVFQQLLTCYSIEHISTNLMTDDKLKLAIRSLRTKLFNKYKGRKWDEILKHQTHTLPKENQTTNTLPKANQTTLPGCVFKSVSESVMSISVRLDNYVSIEHISDFFKDSKPPNMIPRSESKPPNMIPTSMIPTSESKPVSQSSKIKSFFPSQIRSFFPLK